MKSHHRQAFRRLSWFVAVGTIVVFSGCAHSHRVQVDAYTDSGVVPGASYRVVGAAPVRAEAAVTSAASLVRSSLASRGFLEAIPVEDAEVTFEVAIGTGPERLVARSVPGAVYSPDRPGDVRAGVGCPGGLGSEGRGVVVVPGPEPSAGTTVVRMFTKRLSLVARAGSHESGQGQGQPEIWRVEVSVDDEGDDVTAVVPLLVEAAMSHLGRGSVNPILAMTPQAGESPPSLVGAAPAGG